MKMQESVTDNKVGGKTPEEIKKGLELCSHEGHGEESICNRCSYDYNGSPFLECTRHLAKDALAYIQQLESTYSQISKALCSKENATLDEVLKAVDQLKFCLAQAERERDAALKDIANTCWSCRNAKPSQLSKFLYSCPHLKGKAGVRTQCENWQWRGVCPENTKEDPHAD